VIPSNHNWFRNFAVSQILADALDGMKLDMPRPTVDLKEIRRLYHKDVVTEEAKVDGKRKARRAGKKSGKK